MGARNIAKSGLRALELLELFASEQRNLRSSEIADALQLPRSSADQLLKTLLRSGYLTMCPYAKTYFPSPRLVGFGSFIAGAYDRSELLGELLSEVHAATGHIVTLVVQNDCFMQIVDWRGSRPGLPTVERGGRVPMVGSAIGMAVLCNLSTPKVTRILRRARYMNTTAGRDIDIDDLMRDLLTFRRSGYASSRRRLAEFGSADEMISLAVPLPADWLRAPGALGLAGPAAAIIRHEAEIAETLGDAIRSRLARLESGPGMAH